MDLAKQKEIIQNSIDSFNLLPRVFYSSVNKKLKAEWFVSDGDRWKVLRGDGKILGNYLTFDQALLIINALTFYMGESK